MKLVSALTCALLATVAQANYRCRCTPAGRVNNISDDCCRSRITLSDGTRVTGNVESGGFCAYYTSGWSTAEFSNSYANCCRASSGNPATSDGAQCNTF
ncbi:hypothetical protein AA0113_g11102 [Alternaria arborescens]|uniref:Uncharacterized protein n=1 Tax=Alternaria arborescens TaxID=156630 RepID=A0A4Q4QDZ2_9PLEO|nr:hypothetical protein AA0111_g12267 [Alternaria arborescens]RYN17689.1 hypothetical protein AA0112_g11936 [Alternaria arborescens]RYO13373.1 hypothetical protein AA0111_g12267 [Alternaria arborescens]RYO39834.1 hypothetical protein AA0113_g11102 [Alternaria arborescens]